MELPKGVHRVEARGRVYWYFQAGRGTAHAGERIRLPDDPQTPEFWSAVRQAQGIVATLAAETVAELIDAYQASPQFTRLGAGSKDQYQRAQRTARQAWGALPAAGVRPVNMRQMMDAFGGAPGRANNFLAGMRTLSSWALERGRIDQSWTEGVKPYPKTGGHKPWTPEQIACAHQHLTGAVRRFVMLGLYTGQRGSDIVRLGWTDIDDGGFLLRQQKTGREVWCPIVPELAEEMAGWEKAPGPFVRRPDGGLMTRKLAWKAWDAERQDRDELKPLRTATPHGMRATAVIRHRRDGLSTAQIGDIVGMSIPMIERYCRFADRKVSGQAALVSIKAARERRTNGDL